ncbi:hypothetical protein BJY01DRAFT_226240 [Aspergillus pseudoustus]|uniref:Uncharacterized protein n=1 Tax=Aspergillus pseudoustus TaxID=1810923 RepID=A0ABR4IWI3_9EURO
MVSFLFSLLPILFYSLTAAAERLSRRLLFSLSSLVALLLIFNSVVYVERKTLSEIKSVSYPNLGT